MKINMKKRKCYCLLIAFFAENAEDTLLDCHWD
jgi:hypothetical protein